MSEDATLQEHAAADLERNRLPVITPSFVVDGSGLNTRGQKVFPAIGDVQCGDQIRGVINDLFFRSGIDSTFRVVGIDINPGDESVESMALTVNPVPDGIA